MKTWVVLNGVSDGERHEDLCLIATYQHVCIGKGG